MIIDIKSYSVSEGVDECQYFDIEYRPSECTQKFISFHLREHFRQFVDLLDEAGYICNE